MATARNINIDELLLFLQNLREKYEFCNIRVSGEDDTVHFDGIVFKLPPPTTRTLTLDELEDMLD